MGVDTTHNCFRGSYESFGLFCSALAEAAGVPRAHLIARDPALIQRDVLYALLYVPRDGLLETDLCAPLADRLEQLLPFLPCIDVSGRVGTWKNETRTFIAGLRDAASRRENVRFC